MSLCGRPHNQNKMSDKDKNLAKRSSRSEIDAFVNKVRSTPVLRTGGQGRLVFAMDATASREPTWDRACNLQASMFQETAALGGLDIQLCYYRGFGEFHATPWLSSADKLLRQMTGVTCLGGITQIEKVLKHTIRETKDRKVQAVVFVGDCVEEDPDRLCHLAGQLGILGVPVFLFQEGREPLAESTFRQIAKLTRGAWCPFDAGSASQLRDLLSAVAVYAAGGQKALRDFSRTRGQTVRQLTHQLGGD